MYLNTSYQSPIVYQNRKPHNQQQYQQHVMMTPQTSNIIEKQYNPYYQSPMIGYSHYPVVPVSGGVDIYHKKRNSFKVNQTSNNLISYDPTIDEIVNKYRKNRNNEEFIQPLKHERQYSCQTMNSLISKKDSPMTKMNFQEQRKKSEENILWQRNTYLQNEEEGGDRFKNFDEYDNTFNDFPVVQSFKPSALQDQLFPQDKIPNPPLDSKSTEQNMIQQLHQQQNQVDKIISEKLTSKIESVLKTPQIESQINKLDAVLNNKKLVSLVLKFIFALLLLLLIYELFQ